ncbi:MAG TPA: hypothetical protein DEH78_33450, partial [Solibacterales bacterium]|nr:hypothetical protein [Bryobacterales bacterium]
MFRGTQLTPSSASFNSLYVTVPGSLLASAGEATVTVTGLGGTSNAAGLSVLGPPSITSISPEVVAPGAQSLNLVITGSNFVPSSSVLFGSSNISTNVINSTRISASVSSFLLTTAGTYNVTVTTAAGTSNAIPFRVQSPSAISSLSPQTAPAGSPGILLTVNGTGFGASPVVEFGSSTLTPATASSTQVTVQVPAPLLTSPGVVPVRVRSATSTSDPISFTITPPGPAISSLTPAEVQAGSSGFNLTIAGTGFTQGSSVRLGGTPVTPLSISATQIVINVPSASVSNPGNVTVTVSNELGEGTSVLRVLGTMVIGSIEPQSIAAGTDSVVLTVNGTRLPVPGTLYWNDQALTPATQSSETWYVAVPRNLLAAPGTVSIRAQSPNGSSSNSAPLQVLGPAITGISPNSASAGSSGVTLTVNAGNLVAASTVRWNGTPLTTTRTGSGTLQATVPASLLTAAGTANVTVANNDAAVSGPAVFTLLPPPAIGALFPNAAGVGAAPFWMIVAGSGFAGGSTVRWEGQELQTTVDSATQLRAFVTATQLADRGSFQVTVITPSRVVSNPLTFTVGSSVPSLTELSPKSATAGGVAFRLTLRGTSFSPQATVMWNGSGIVSAWASATEITATVPANLLLNPTTASIWVVNPGGGTSNIQPFAIDPPAAGTPSITSTSPLPAGEVAQPYSFAFRATGGATPYRGWAAIAGALPAGLRLNADGVLTGTPTVAGTYQFTVELTDATPVATSRMFTLVIDGPMRISEAGIVNAASGRGGMVSPGEVLLISGSGLGPGEIANLQTDERGYVMTSAGGTRVLFDGLAAPVLSSSAGQVRVVAPYALAASTVTKIQVLYQGRGSNVVTLPVTPVKPGIFTAGQGGLGQGAIRNSDGTENSPARPAAPGSVVSLFATGEGQTSPLGVDGKPGGMPAAEPVAQPVMVVIGGQLARVLFAGGAPTLVAGIMQVNVEIPAGITPGDALPVVLLVGGVPTQAGV